MDKQKLNALRRMNRQRSAHMAMGTVKEDFSIGDFMRLEKAWLAWGVSTEERARYRERLKRLLREVDRQLLDLA